jgi:hypothetical protein
LVIVPGYKAAINENNPAPIPLLSAAVFGVPLSHGEQPKN